jgi:hypothetical protein
MCFQPSILEGSIVDKISEGSAHEQVESKAQDNEPLRFDRKNV